MGLGEMDRLLDVWENLGPRERCVVLTFMTRLWSGQKKYGPLKQDKKNWGYEAYEELLDASVYLTAQLNDFVDGQRSTIPERAAEAVAAAPKKSWIENYYKRLGPEAVELAKLDPKQEWYWIDVGPTVEDRFGNVRITDVPGNKVEAAARVFDVYGVQVPVE